MLFFWYPALTLMLDAMQVVDMRLRLVANGKATLDEMFLMTQEKIDALAQARTILIRGGNPEQILETYRKIVAANVERLSI